MPASSAHLALLYDDANALSERVAAYLTDDACDGIAMVIGRAERLSGLEQALAARGLDLADARRTERLVTLDAEATLAAIFVEAMPDRAAFHDRVGALVARLARRGALRVYSEMADLLRSTGRSEAVPRLEELWRDVDTEHGYTLLCSHRATSPADPLGPGLLEICAAHDRLPPADSLDTEHARARAIDELEARLRRAEGERDEQARACRAAREAQHAAEALLRTRDEVLAVVTHDLRNPLGTIVMGATALLQHGGADPRAQRERSVAERIHRQAERMARQIRDLQDYVEISAGRLAIERAPHAPSAILATISELAAPVARERGIGFEARAAAELPAIDCDGDRVVQALASLVATAIKATPRGGTVEAGARLAEGGRIVFFVHHPGPAIDGDTAAVFEPGWRSQQPSYRGAALGFTIARGVVAAHGGTIWVENRPGAGATVAFSLH